MSAVGFAAVFVGFAAVFAVVVSLPALVDLIGAAAAYLRARAKEIDRG